MTGPMLLDELGCTGDEARLLECPHNGWGRHDCEQAEAVGVRCLGEPGSPPPGGAVPPPGVLPAPTPALGRNLTVPPPVRCLALPANRTGDCGADSVPPLFYFEKGVNIIATYRVVYEYPDGAHSCPSPLEVSANITRGGPEVLVRLDNAAVQSVAAQAAAAVKAAGGGAGSGGEGARGLRLVLQRRGLSGTVLGLGPDWLVSTWVNVFSAVLPSPGDVRGIDGYLFYNASEGSLNPPGPAVAGWRWKYGSLGFTDGYLPSVLPALTASYPAFTSISNSTSPDGAEEATGSGGISATYQLTYELAGGRFSFPHPTRFAVRHPVATTPLLLYVQLASTVHPADLAALLLQRVEGGAVWTVARLGASSPVVVSGQRGLVFLDATSRDTHEVEVDVPAMVGPLLLPGFSSSGVRAVAGDPPAPGGPSDVGSGSGGGRWGITLDGAGAGGLRLTLIDSVIAGVPLSPHGPLLWCRGCEELVLVNVTIRDLAPHEFALTGGSADAPVASATAGAESPSASSSPPSPTNGTTYNVHGALAAGGLVAARVAETTCSDVRGAHGWACLLLGFKPPSSCNLAVRPRAPYNHHHHHHQQASAATDGPPPQLSVEHCALERNQVVAAGGVADASAGPMRDLLLRAGLGGAGAIAVVAEDDRVGAGGGGDGGGGEDGSGGSGGGGSSAAPLSLRITDSVLSGNAGGSGAALYSGAWTGSVLVWNSSLSSNKAECGGALYLASNVSRLVVHEGSAVDNNTATQREGGAFFVAGSLGELVVDGRSSVSSNAAFGDGGGGLFAELEVRYVAVQGGSSADRNRAPGFVTAAGSADDGSGAGGAGNGAGDAGGDVAAGLNDGGYGGFVASDGRSVRTAVSSNKGTTFVVSGGSSVCGNSARQGGVLLTYWLESFVVSDGSRVDRNSASLEAGVLQVVSLFYFDTEEYYKDRHMRAVLITGNSSMSYNVAYKYGVMSLPDYSTLALFHVDNNSRVDANGADVAPAVLYCDTMLDIVVSGNSSMSYNDAGGEGDGGVIFAWYSVRSLYVESGGRVCNNTLRSGKGGVLYTRTLTSIALRGGAIVANNSASGNGGVVSVNALTGGLDISGGAALSNNTALYGSGGAVAVQTDMAWIHVDGGAVVGNAASQDGGAVHVGRDLVGNAVLRNGAVVEGNRAVTRNGGFVSLGRYLTGYFWLRNGSRLCDCSAGVSGGALFVRETVFVELYVGENSTACRNAAYGMDGGMAYIGFGTDRVQVQGGSSVVGNSAAGYGGAVYVGRQVTNVTVAAGSSMTDNHAGADGGALFADAVSNLVLSGAAAADGNTAGGDGGLLRASRLTSLALLGSRAAANVAGRSGGVVAVQAPPDAVLLEGCELSGNVAERGAGGVLSIAVPQPGSPLLSQVAGRARYVVRGGSVLAGNGAYLDGGALCVAADAASDPTGPGSNAPAVELTVLLTGSHFSANYAGGAGGVLSLSSPAAGALSARVLVSDCTFGGNVAGAGGFLQGSSTSSGYGGAIAVASTPKFRADAVMAAVQRTAAAAAAVTNASAAAGGERTGGGDSALEAAAALLQGEGARGTGDGGASEGAGVSVSLDSACSLRLERSTFEGNACEQSGGAVAAVSCPTVVANCSFRDNVAGIAGGGFAAIVEAVLVGDIAGQAAVGAGRRRQQELPVDGIGDGAVASGSTAGGEELLPYWLQVSNTAFESNVARWGCGGGLYAEVAVGAGAHVGGGSAFRNNSAADYHGGGVCILSHGSGAVAVVSNGTLLSHNTAARFGGGVFATLASGSGNSLTVNGSVVLHGNSAAAGGALAVAAAPGSAAELWDVNAFDNIASNSGGALAVQCGDDDTVSAGASCGPEPLLTVSRCGLHDNAATKADGGAVYVAAGASAALYDSVLASNRAGRSGGGVAAAGCSGLVVVNVSISGSAAAQHGGGVFTHSCERVLLRNLNVTDNRAASGGAAFFAGLSDDNTTVAAVAAAAPPSAAARVVMLLDSMLARNLANVSDSGYRRFAGHGGGVFAYGNVSVLVAGTDLRDGNGAVAGSALASSQQCAAPRAGEAALAALVQSAWVRAGGGIANASAGGSAASLSQPPSEAETFPVWMADPLARSLQARCGHRDDHGPSSATSVATPLPPAPAPDCGSSDPALAPTCALYSMLAPCTEADDATETRLLEYASPASSASSSSSAASSSASAPPAAGRLAGSLLDVVPTHMVLESFQGQLRPGTPISISVRLYNGLMQPVQRDTLSVRISVAIEPAAKPLPGAEPPPTAAAAPGDGSQLLPSPQAPWQDAAIAYLDPGTATGGSLAVPVARGRATWPYLTARGWPGRYVLVFTATELEDRGLFTIPPLRVSLELLRCQPGEALDLSWSQQLGAQPSWLACERCGRGRFSLWRDERPDLWDVNATNYRQFMKEWASEAAEGAAACMPCPDQAICLGGALLAPGLGYWHSAPDSALFHRCPKEDACGKSASWGAGGWSSMPAVLPSRLQIMISAAGVLVNLNATAAAGGSGNDTTDGDYGSSGGSALASTATSSVSPPDPRSGWLGLCQLLWYHQATVLGFNADASTSSAAAGPSTPAANVSRTGGDGGAGWTDMTRISGVRELVSVCSALGEGVHRGDLATNPYLQLQCATGYASHLCATCTPGYFINAEFECRQCNTLQASLSLAVLSFLGGVALVLITNLRENYAVTHDGTSIVDEAASPADFLKVAIVHAQYYIIITRLPVAYPESIAKMQATISAVTGAESTVAFSYSCFFPGQPSAGQARAQLLGALLVPVVVVAVSMTIWTIRYLFFNRARMRRAGNLRSRNARKTPRSIEAAAAAAVATAVSHSAAYREDDWSSLPSVTSLRHSSVFIGTSVESEACGLPPRAASGAEDATRRSIDSPRAQRAAAVEFGPAVGPVVAPPITGPPSAGSGIRSKVSMARVRKALSSSFQKSNLLRILMRLDETLGLWQQLGILLMIAVFILYPGWAQAALSVFACYRIDDGVSGPFPERQQATWEYGYWIRDMAQRCYSGTHLAQYVPIGVAAVATFCLAPPLVSFALLWRNRRKLDAPGVRQRYGFLYSRYKDRYFWWESVLMLEELALVAVEVFGRALPVVSHQILLMLAAFILLSLVNMACAPARSRVIVLLEFLSMGVLSLTVTLSLYFVVSESIGTAAANTVGLIIMILNIALMAGFLLLVLRQSWGTVSARGASLARGIQRKPEVYIPQEYGMRIRIVMESGTGGNAATGASP
ncbi:hypothetical protein GPECTOR_53g81 [Gonium pectorale]|uniref:SRCR domain-containing protein n=1 Tax=Gonium pectorale TaxID=33097 RepID=A0A150G6Y1_GONPE|nr:hypothetical protein GPECTOR_53g81 [Gonium pectorale]|eukprot:KXZ45588.1 hypothetical protein GPECTOR_53g81 [Gonium pectorale]